MTIFKPRSVSFMMGLAASACLSAEALAQAAPEAQRSAMQTASAPARRGILTPVGRVVVEPALEYAHTDMNRFAIGGVAILDTVLIGAFDATQADRDAVTASLGARTGLWENLEIETRIPYVYRNDRSTSTIVNTNTPVSTSEIDSNDIGDAEFALHYQINQGLAEWPIFVANLRVKSTTGTSPYDVSRTDLGIEEELATGSGFWGIEPSVNLIFPSDPAVFYASLGYMWNMKDDINKQIGNRFIEEVDPGDAVRVGFGLGLSVNERLSVSLGYQHDFIMATETTYSTGQFDSDSLSSGALSLGFNYQATDKVALNLNITAGVTEDAPDVRIMLRTPISLDL